MTAVPYALAAIATALLTSCSCNSDTAPVPSTIADAGFDSGTSTDTDVPRSDASTEDAGSSDAGNDGGGDVDTSDADIGSRERGRFDQCTESSGCGGELVCDLSIYFPGDYDYWDENRVDQGLCLRRMEPYCGGDCFEGCDDAGGLPCPNGSHCLWLMQAPGDLGLCLTLSENELVCARYPEAFVCDGFSD